MCLTLAIFRIPCSIRALARYGLCLIISMIGILAERLARESGFRPLELISKSSISAIRSNEHLASEFLNTIHESGGLVGIFPNVCPDDCITVSGGAKTVYAKNVTCMVFGMTNSNMRIASEVNFMLPSMS